MNSLKPGKWYLMAHCQKCRAVHRVSDTSFPQPVASMLPSNLKCPECGEEAATDITKLLWSETNED
jgi:hypothetical protein